MASNNFTEIDFLKLRNSLKEFLKNQDKFTDYDFEGAGLSVLLDLLTYTTQYGAFYSNMVANEMFLDSAILRESVISRAKAIGYRPHSRISAKAKIDIDIDTLAGGGPANPGSILVPKYTRFTTNVNGKIYDFLTVQSHTLTSRGGGKYGGVVEVVEGKQLTHRFTVDNTLEPRQRFLLPNANIDTTTLTVKIQESVNVPNIAAFNLSNDLNVLDSESQVFFLQEAEDQKYEIYFGDGVVGKKLDNGNIVIVEYLVSAGEVVNSASKFILTNSAYVGGYSVIVLTTVEAANSAVEIQDINSIKALAPLFYETQNRAVNKHDYETLIMKDYPQVEFVRVWGGEENDPPVYGKVYMALKPKGALAFNEQEKLSILNSIIRPRSPVSIESVIVEPDYLKVIVDVDVKYKGKSTTLTSGEIQTAVINAVKTYRDENLLGFDSRFRYSKLTKAIDESEDSIQNNLTNIKIKYTITPPLNLPQKYEIFLNAKISKGDASNNVSSLNSTGFYKDGLVSYLGDDGAGNIYIYRIIVSQKVVVENNVGTINYDTGKISIPSLTIQSVEDGSEFIHLTLVPAENDLNPVRNQILLIEDEDISVSVIDEDI